MIYTQNSALAHFKLKSCRTNCPIKTESALRFSNRLESRRMPRDFQSGSSRIVIYRNYQRTRLARNSILSTRRYLNIAQYFERSEIAHLPRECATCQCQKGTQFPIRNTECTLIGEESDSRVSQSRIGANSNYATKGIRTSSKDTFLKTGTFSHPWFFVGWFCWRVDTTRSRAVP